MLAGVRWFSGSGCWIWQFKIQTVQWKNSSLNQAIQVQCFWSPASRNYLIPFGGFLIWGIPKSPWVSVLTWSNDLDDLRYPHLGNLLFMIVYICVSFTLGAPRAGMPALLGVPLLERAQGLLFHSDWSQGIWETPIRILKIAVLQDYIVVSKCFKDGSMALSPYLGVPIRRTISEVGFTFGFLRAGFGFRFFGFRVSGFGFWFSGFGFRLSGFGFRVPVLGFRVSGLGLV